MTEFNKKNIEELLLPLLDKIGFLIEGRAKIMCPVDTGRLRASIQHNVDLEEMSVSVGTNVPYAKYVEYRYDVNSPKMGRETGQMPFLRPSIFQAKEEIERMIKEHFRKNL